MRDVLLREVAEDAAEQIPSVELRGVLVEGSRRARHRRMRKRGVLGAMLGGAAAAALLVPLPHLLRTSVPASPAPKIVVRIELSTTTARTGSSIPVVVLITNTTGHPISTLDTCPDPKYWLAVGLTRPGVPFEALFTLPGCRPSLQLPPGTSQFATTISANFNHCAMTRAGATSTNPWCGSPQLPPGRYTTEVVVTIDPRATQYPPPVTVTLTP